MQRRTFLSLLAIPAVAQLLQACGDDGTSGPSGSSGSGSGSGSGEQRASLRADAPRVLAGDAEAIEASAAINAFSADLFQRLVEADPTANLVFSPASIALALAMVTAGAEGATLAEMDAVLHITDPATIHRSMNGLSTALSAVNQTVDQAAEGGTGVSEVQLSIANSLWGQTDYRFEQAFLDLLATEYGAGMELVDFKLDPEAARVAINAWVDEQTKQRIPELLPPASINAEMRLALVNAIYLKANWANAFNEARTADEPFAAPDGELTVQMMHTTVDLAYGEGEGWRAVEIPYVFGGLSFLVAMGDNEGTPMPSADEAAAATISRLVELGLPKFDIETRTLLGQDLRAMGMTSAFTDGADFSGMTTEELGVKIGEVIHQANITVDEKGTEAAAATAVLMPTAESMAPEPPEPVVFTVDRPFTFWLRDRATGTIIFSGRVNDPSATRG
ncbi:MAG: serpin family protein [Ilumatobacteraceae bacterium]